MLFRKSALIVVALGWIGLATPAAAQGWVMVDTEGSGGAGASVCAEGPEAPCFRVTCEGDTPLHYSLALFGANAQGQPDEVAVELRIDGRAAGLLRFTKGDSSADMTTLNAPYDPRLHGPLIAQLRKGGQAELAIRTPDAAVTVPLSLRGSSKSLGAVMQTCPLPEPPMNDPAAMVLDEVVRACGQLGGSVAVDPGFERHEDLDGDGRDDVVIDYAAAVCSEMASLYCGSGGCTVGFFLAREDGFARIFDGVIRGYAVKPGGLLALDLHGTACGLYGFEACRKVFRISDDSFALVEEISGAAAEAAQAADRAAAQDAATEAPAADMPEPEPEPADPPDDSLDPVTNADPAADDATAPPAPEIDGQDGAGDMPAAAPGPQTEPGEPMLDDPQTLDAPPDADAPAASTGLEWVGDGGAVALPVTPEPAPDVTE